ncbi:spore germination protein [Bacillus sp. OxB-1]|uniref:GerAB/ArcD/ProY family transporter n=1 Tax=Bacillus sp. (strain OxB-1) TaxID=98228 RepID=UPI000582178A|nr:GerAB/ArcD/ProY family transporter [Bacillus sp. OxB-1]BAQ08810.1 spore germination protein [Bacillus sp. OxB-1]
MSRFLFYLILVNMLANMVSLTPRILISGSDSGAVLSLIIAIPVGMVLTYIIISLFSLFPGQGLPEILKAHTPKWISMPILLFFSILWYIAGLSTLIIYTFIIIRFITPEMSIYIIVLTFVLVITYGISMTPKNILYLSEIVFIIIVPFIAFILIKGYLSHDLDWDYIRVAVMHINHLPDYLAFSTSLFIVIGAANLVIFNRFFTNLKKPTWKGMTLFTAVCTFILFSTYFLPIGFGGFDSLKNVLYPWIMTSDSMRMKFGIIERIVFFFISAFLGLAVISMIMHWHVSIQLLSSVIHFKRFKWKKYNLTMPFFIVCFWAFGIFTTKKITLNGLYKTVRLFDQIFLPILLLLLIGCLLLAKKGAASKCQESKK